jgi:hypothetical protein
LFICTGASRLLVRLVGFSLAIGRELLVNVQRLANLASDSLACEDNNPLLQQLVAMIVESQPSRDLRIAGGQVIDCERIGIGQNQFKGRAATFYILGCHSFIDYCLFVILKLYRLFIFCQIIAVEPLLLARKQCDKSRMQIGFWYCNYQ